MYKRTILLNSLLLKKKFNFNLSFIVQLLENARRKNYVPITCGKCLSRTGLMPNLATLVWATSVSVR